MKNCRNISVGILYTAVLFFIGFSQIQAQEFNLINQESSLKVYGTSSLHDWHIDAEKQSGKIKFESIEICKIDQLVINIESESLKSGKSTMDKNTYKALNTSQHKSIMFKLTEVKNVTSKGVNAYKINALGNLTIAGVTKQIPLSFKAIIKGGKTILEGEKTFNMTDFKVDPPKALFGTITTGDEVTIKFSTIFK